MVRLDKITEIKFECIPLEWDTNYFGVKSMRVNLHGIIDRDTQNTIISLSNECEFLNISNLNNLKENNQWIGTRTNAFLADVNIQFIKKLDKGLYNIDEKSFVSANFERNDEILRIAKNAFRYSRFFNDSKLQSEQSKNIYQHWTECSFNKKNKYFVICKRKNQVAGYILFSMNEEEKSSVIELIAVDEKFRRQEVGKSLIQSMQSYVIDRNINKIKVGTQVDNVSAIQFYNVMGFKYVRCNSIYHLWSLDKKVSE